jgi:hypothetical protein
MTTNQIQERTDKAKGLNVLQVSDGEFFVESDEGKVAYRVCLGDEVSCTCGDYIKNIKTDTAFRCKHILAALGWNGNDEVKKPKLNENFIKNLQGKDFVLYSGLLDLAHQKGLNKLEIEVVQQPTQDNGYEAICKAVAQTRFGEVFTDIGDASPKNTNKVIANHILRMASTRAKARALRDLTNIGITCLEELGDINEVLGEESQAASAQQHRPVAESKNKKPNGNGKDKPAPPEGGNGSKDLSKPPDIGAGQADTAGDNGKDRPEGKISDAQKRAVQNLSKRRGISDMDLNDMSTKKFGVPVEQLSLKDASGFIRSLQSAD